MKLAKAIKTTDTLIKHPKIVYTADDLDALKLLIEAGKREVASRARYDNEDPWLLPGETEEVS